MSARNSLAIVQTAINDVDKSTVAKSWTTKLETR